MIAALAELPEDLDREVIERCEAQLVVLCEEFGPRQLRILGRRVLDVVAPEVAEEAERKALEREAERARRRTFLTTRRNGDGTTEVRMRLADAVADRLLTYLHAFTSPRRTPLPGQAVMDCRGYDQKLGHAFGGFLETVDPDRLPVHGGDATTVVVTIDLDTLRNQLGDGAKGLDGMT